MTDDAELLRRYVETHDDAAFAEIVRRHLGFVYHAALRQCGGDAHRAEDVAQAVFIDLARKAASLARRPVLPGWLYTSTRYAASQAVRTEARRQAREQEAHAMNEMLSKPAATAEAASAAEWERLRPAIDDALHALGERDREAVLLRFFEGRAFAEVGAKLSLSEDAARMRVERALEKMRAVFSRHGVSSTTTALAVALANQPVVATPAGLATAVTGAALAGAATGGGALAAFLSMTTTAKTTLAAALVIVAAVTAYYTLQSRDASSRQVAGATDRVATPPKPESNPTVKSIEAPPSPSAPAPKISSPKATTLTLQNPPVLSAIDEAALNLAKAQLAHVGNIAKDGRIQAGQGVNEATIAVVHAWIEQDAQAALQWLATVPLEGNQRMHTLEALIAIETEPDPEIAFLLANSISLESSRISRLRDVLRAWAPRDAAAATAAVRSADVSEENRALLLTFVDRESQSPSPKK